MHVGWLVEKREKDEEKDEDEVEGEDKDEGRLSGRFTTEVLNYKKEKGER